MKAKIRDAVVWIPPELQNISNKIPKVKLPKSKTLLLLFTGYNMINKTYGYGFMYPNKLMLLNINTCNDKKTKKRMLFNTLLFTYFFGAVVIASSCCFSFFFLFSIIYT